MITIAGNVSAVQAEFARIGARVLDTVESGVVSALDDLMVDMEGATPVVSGLMRSSYSIASGGGTYELIDTATSPQGYEYPGRVAFDPGFSAAYDALNAVLDSADQRIETSVESLLAGLAGTP